ncbi:hypothetical protein GCM10009634_13470 [Saccharothrix xinjiangensis]
MALRQQGDQRDPHHVGLADDDLLHVGGDPPDHGVQLGEHLVRPALALLDLALLPLTLVRRSRRVVVHPGAPATPIRVFRQGAWLGTRSHSTSWSRARPYRDRFAVAVSVSRSVSNQGEAPHTD